MYDKKSIFSVAAALGFAVSSTLAGRAAYAFEFDTGNSDVKIRWDNTLKYSAAWRVKDRSDNLSAFPNANGNVINLNDGDRNFDKGIVSNRLDLLSEFDAGTKNLGVRVSAAGWYDTVYNHSNDNNLPATSNSTSVPPNEFTDATRRLHGRDAEILDAFVFAKGQIGSIPATVRAGRHTLIYGESLFFGANGVANAQGPVDLVKLLSVPSSQFKEILRPVEQISGLLQIRPNVSVGAYYQLKWHESIIPGAGSYLSDADFVGAGSESIFFPFPPFVLTRGPDIKARNSGQGGLQLRFTPEGGDVEYGLYAAQYHDKGPSLYFDFTKPNGAGLIEVFPEDIKTYGVSASTSVGQLNIAGEMSVRRNTPLVSDPQLIFVPGTLADNNSHPLYAVGNSAHAQISGIYVLTPTALWQGGALLAEIAWNRRTSVTQNPDAIAVNTTRDATAIRLIFEPAYFQVLPGLDITVPIGLGYNLDGRSSVVFKFNGGTTHAGDMSVGVNGTYRQVWQFGLNYIHYLGAEDPFLIPSPAGTPMLSFKQSLKDRDFISFNFKRAF